MNSSPKSGVRPSGSGHVGSWALRRRKRGAKSLSALPPAVGERPSPFQEGPRLSEGGRSPFSPFWAFLDIGRPQSLIASHTLRLPRALEWQRSSSLLLIGRAPASRIQ